MATSSEVKTGLDDISASIRAERQALKSCQARVSTALATLTNLPTQFSDVVATVNGFAPATTDDFELLAKAELAKLTTEFQALKAKAQTADTALAAIDFAT